MSSQQKDQVRERVIFQGYDKEYLTNNSKMKSYHLFSNTSILNQLSWINRRPKRYIYQHKSIPDQDDVILSKNPSQVDNTKLEQSASEISFIQPRAMDFSQRNKNAAQLNIDHGHLSRYQQLDHIAKMETYHSRGLSNIFRQEGISQEIVKKLNTDYHSKPIDELPLLERKQLLLQTPSLLSKFGNNLKMRTFQMGEITSPTDVTCNLHKGRRNLIISRSGLLQNQSKFFEKLQLSLQYSTLHKSAHRRTQSEKINQLKQIQQKQGFSQEKFVRLCQAKVKNPIKSHERFYEVVQQLENIKQIHK